MKKIVLLCLPGLLVSVMTLGQACINANAGPDQTICSGGGVVLGASAQPGFNYSWSPSWGLSNAAIAQPVASPPVSMSYQLIVTPANATNLVTNGNFESGNAGFQTDYLMWPQSLQTGGFGSYLVTDNPRNMRNYFFTPPLPNQGNTMLVVDGSSAFSNNHIVWSQQVNNLTPNTDYSFSFFISCISPQSNGGALPDISVIINGVTIFSGHPIDQTRGVWEKVQGLWNSGNNTSALIEMHDDNTAASGNDFAIDGIELFPACTGSIASDQVNVNVNFAIYPIQLGSITMIEGSLPPVSLPVGYSQACYGWESSVQLIVTSNATNNVWYINYQQVNEGYNPNIGVVHITNNTQTLTLYPDPMRYKVFSIYASGTVSACPNSSQAAYVYFAPTYYPGASSYINGNYLGMIDSRNTWTKLSSHIINPGPQCTYTFPPGIITADANVNDPEIEIYVTDDYAGPSYEPAGNLYYIPVQLNTGYTGCATSHNLYCPVPGANFRRRSPPAKPTNPVTVIEEKNVTADNALIYPNPAKDVLFVHTGNALGSTFKIEIVNAMGQVIKPVVVASQGNSVLKIPVNGLAAGIYTLVIRTERKTLNKKFIINR